MNTESNAQELTTVETAPAIEPAEPVLEQSAVESVEYTAEDFAREYNALVDRMGYRINVNPAFAATNHGSFEVVMQYAIGKLPKKTE
jgi:hypothetical protein